MRLVVEILERHRDAIPDLGGQPAVMRALFNAAIKEIVGRGIVGGRRERVTTLVAYLADGTTRTLDAELLLGEHYTFAQLRDALDSQAGEMVGLPWFVGDAR